MPTPMALPKASNVKDDVEKEQTNETVTTAINNTDDHGEVVVEKQ